MKKTALVLCAALALAACTSSMGTKVDQSKMSQFHKGSTTYDDVVAALGQPNQIINDDQGNKTAQYTFVGTRIKPETYIPVYGAFKGGVDSENSTAIFVFNSRNILVRSSSSQGGMASNPR